MSGTRKRKLKDRRGQFGSLRMLPSGNIQARYRKPGDGRMVTAPTTFQTTQDAETWLSMQKADIVRGKYLPEHRRAGNRTQFDQYAQEWLSRRDLSPRTRQGYSKLLEQLMLPRFGNTALNKMTAEDVLVWHTDLGQLTGPTRRSHAYSLLRTIMQSALLDGLIDVNPCHIRGAGKVQRAKNIRPATLDELAVIVEAMPDRLRLMTLLASWCALRFGETAELRRKDIDLEHGLVLVRRGVTRIDGAPRHVGPPKSVAGSRDVAVPPHLMPLVVEHLANFTDEGKNALLFPAKHGGHLATATLYRHFYRARHLAGRDDLRWHDLRHTGAVLAAQTGATLAELMARLGHSSPQMALRYQHAAAGRDREIADQLSAMASGKSE